MPPMPNSSNETTAAAPALDCLDIPHGSARKKTLCCTKIQSTLMIVVQQLRSLQVPNNFPFQATDPPKNTSSVPCRQRAGNNTIYVRVFVDVCCSSCRLSDLLASHSSQHLSFVFRFIFFVSFLWNSCPHYHLLAAHGTPKKRLKIPISFAYWVKT